jgi:hypothetical protein
MKNSPRPLFLLRQTLQFALCIGAGGVLLTSQICPSDCQMVKRDSSLQRMYFHCSSPIVVSFTPLQPTLGIAHDDIWLVCGCSAMEAHFMKLLTNRSCADVASRGSLELCSECCNRGQIIFTRYALQHSAVSFCELVWPPNLWVSRC